MIDVERSELQRVNNRIPDINSSITTDLNQIKSELEKMLKNDRQEYEKFFNNFGRQLKFGVYDNYGMNKNLIQILKHKVYHL